MGHVLVAYLGGLRAWVMMVRKKGNLDAKREVHIKFHVIVTYHREV